MNKSIDINVKEGSDFVKGSLIKPLPIIPIGLVKENRVWISVVLFPRLQMFISVNFLLSS